MERMKNLNVLFIDDEELMRDVARLMFEDIGWKGHIASTAGEGVKTFRDLQDEIDLVIIDFSMPEMNGMQTARALKEINADVKIVLISGLICDEEIQEQKDIGTVGFMSKPFLYEDLIDCIEQNFPDLS